MFRLSFAISNPFTNSKFTSFFAYSGKIYNNKYWELQAIRDMTSVLHFELDISFIGHDHAGPSFSLGLLGHHVMLKIYDNRHWDHDVGDWEK